MGGAFVAGWEMEDAEDSKTYILAETEYNYTHTYTGWWFQTYFILGSSFPLTFIFFRGVETTNQYIYIFVISTCYMSVFNRFQLQITKSIMLRGPRVLPEIFSPGISWLTFRRPGPSLE